MNQTGLSTFNQARIEWAIRLRYSPMPKLTMEWLRSNLNAFRIGELRVIGKMWEIMMESDGELAVNADKRAADLAGLDYQVVSDGSPDGDRHAAALTYFYEHINVSAALEQDVAGGMSQLLEDMASAHSYFYSAHEILLRVDNPEAREITAEFRRTPIWFFECRRGYLGYLQHIFDMYGTPCIEGEWLTCIGKGWMRPLSIAYLIKSFSLRDWNVWCQRYGSGFLEGITDASFESPEWNEAAKALTTLANDGAVLHSKGVEMKFLAQSARNHQPFEPLVQWADQLYAKCYRGVDLATGSRSASAGGGTNPIGATIQKEESGIFLVRDALWATNYLNRRLDRPIIRYLFDQEPRAAVAIMPPLEDTADIDLNVLKTVVPLGLKIALADVYKKFKWAPPGKGEPCLEAPVAPAANPADPGSARAPRADIGAPADATPPKPSGGGAGQEHAGARVLPKPADATQEQTQPALSTAETPIGAGADLGAAVQSASPLLPDPQVQAGSLLSQAGAAVARAMNLNPNLKLNPNP